MLSRSLANKATNIGCHGSDTSSSYGGSDVLPGGSDDTTQKDFYDVSMVVGDDASISSESDTEDEGNVSEISSLKSIALLDHIKDCFDKDPEERSEEDVDIMMSFIQPIRAFNSMTHTTKQKLCRQMRLVCIERSDAVIMSDGEELDSWSVILHGSVEVVMVDGRIQILRTGDTFGVTLSAETEFEEGEMKAREDDCIFICVARSHYQETMNEIKEITVNIEENNEVVLVFEKRVEHKRENLIVIKGKCEKLIEHLLDYNSNDANFMEDMLLTFPAFLISPILVADKLITWFQNYNHQEKVAKILLHWVNNHYQDFDFYPELSSYIEKFQLLFFKQGMYGQLSLLHMACNRHTGLRQLQLQRQQKDQPLGFCVEGGMESKTGVFVVRVDCSKVKAAGLKRGDQILEVNNRSFEQIKIDDAIQCLQISNNLCLVVKSNFTEFFRHTQISELNNGPLDTGSVFEDLDDHSIFSGSSIRSDLSGNSSSSSYCKDSQPRSKSDMKTLDMKIFNKNSSQNVEADVIKIYRPDETSKHLFIHKETTCREVAMLAVAEFQLAEASCNYNLYEIFFENGGLTKTKLLPPQLKDLASHASLHSRYYLRHTKNSEPSPSNETCQSVLSDCRTSLTDIEEADLSEKLFQRAQGLFRSIQARDYIDDLFKVAGRYPTASLLNVSKLVNEEMFWVINEICVETNVTKRVKLIKSFIKIANLCYLSRNFNSLFAIVSGLGHKSVNRLKVTWKRISDKYIKIFEELQQFLDPTRNMFKYRNALNTNIQSKATIPLFPLVLKDLTFLHLGNNTKVDGLINFEKMRSISNEIRKINKFSCFSSQNSDTMVKRNLTTSISVKKIFEEMMSRKRVEYYLGNMRLVYDEDQLDQLSEKCEPSKKKRELKLVKRLSSKKLKNHRSFVENMFGADDPESFHKLLSLSTSNDRISKRSQKRVANKNHSSEHRLETKSEEKVQASGRSQDEMAQSGAKKPSSINAPNLSWESSSVIPSSPTHAVSKSLLRNLCESADNDTTLTRLSCDKADEIYIDKSPDKLLAKSTTNLTVIYNDIDTSLTLNRCQSEALSATTTSPVNNAKVYSMKCISSAAKSAINNDSVYSDSSTTVCSSKNGSHTEILSQDNLKSTRIERSQLDAMKGGTLDLYVKHPAETASLVKGGQSRHSIETKKAAPFYAVDVLKVENNVGGIRGTYLEQQCGESTSAYVFPSLEVKEDGTLKKKKVPTATLR